MNNLIARLDQLDGRLHAYFDRNTIHFDKQKLQSHLLIAQLGGLVVLAVIGIKQLL